jgi:anti-sigma-K factor RskA
VKCEHEFSVGAYVLDALEPAEQLRMQRHVQECPICADIVRELDALPRLLAAVPTPGEEPAASALSETAFERFRRSAAGEQPRRRRTGRWGAAAVAALVAVAATTAVLVVANLDPDPVVVEASDGVVHVRASYEEAGDGTSVTVALDGVPVGAHCELVAGAADGDVSSAGAWRITYDGTYHWHGWVDLGPERITWFELRRLDGTPLVKVPAEGS